MDGNYVISFSLNECVMWVGYAFLAYQCAALLGVISVGSYLLWKRRQGKQVTTNAS